MPPRRSALRWLGAIALAGAAALAAVGGLTGCSSSGSSAPGAGQGEVSGTVTMVGGPAGAAADPAPGEVYAFKTADLSGQPVAKQKTKSDGSYRLNLAPGTYYLAASSSSYVIDPPPPAPPCRADASITVTTGGQGQLAIYCQRR